MCIITIDPFNTRKVIAAFDNESDAKYTLGGRSKDHELERN